MVKEKAGEISSAKGGKDSGESLEWLPMGWEGEKSSINERSQHEAKGPSS